MKISIIGIGNFGFALIRHLSVNLINHPDIKIFAYDRNPTLIKNLQIKRKHLYHHKNISILENVILTHRSKNAFQKSDLKILAVTSQAIIDIMKDNARYINHPSIILNTAKALEYKSGKRFSEIILTMPEVKNNQYSFAVLSGGTIASDLFLHQPLGVDIASKNKKTLKILKKIFVSDNLNVYTTSDVAGVEFAGAFKNVISILAGIISGLNYSYGSETHFITRASAEVKKLVHAEKTYTFSMQSQCWGNDLWLSCTGNTRNRQFGELLGRGHSAHAALKKITSARKSVEGVNTIKCLKRSFDLNKYPILNSLVSIVKNNNDPQKIISKLMAGNKM